MANWFVGLPVPAGAWFEPYIEGAPPGLRRFSATDLHITVAFLGSCGAEAAAEAWTVAKALDVPRVEARLAGLKAMGSHRSPSALSLTLSGGEAEVAEFIAAARGPLIAAAGARPDTRAPLPHLTVARPPKRGGLDDATKAWLQAPPVGAEVLLDRLALYTWADRRDSTLFTVKQQRPSGPGTAIRYEGGCHCGEVRFAVRVRDHRALDCNCSICARKGNLHLIVQDDDFELLGGEDALAEYTFGTGIARHWFCRTCGIHPFYRPRSHPEGWDVNVRCLDGGVRSRFEVVPFDGARWEANVASIR